MATEFLYSLFQGFYNDLILKMIFTLVGISIFIGVVYFIFKVITSIIEYIDDEIGFDNIFSFIIKSVLLIIGTVVFLVAYDFFKEQKTNIHVNSLVETKNSVIKKIKSHYPNANNDDLELIYDETRYFNLELGLVYAIAATESSFIRSKKSKSNAYGLFQLKIDAAKDATVFYNNYQKITPDLLQFNEVSNIELGVAYIYLLWSKYLRHIDDEEKRKLILVYSYNGGIGRVLRIFNANSYEAQLNINNLSINSIKSILNNRLLKKGFQETVTYQKRVYRRIHLFSNYSEFEILASSFDIKN